MGRDREWLRAGRAGNRIPVDGEIFRTRPGRPRGPPSLLYNGYRVSLPRVKRPERGETTHPHLGPRLKKRVQLYLQSPSGPYVACSGVTFTFTFTFLLNHPAVEDLNMDKACNHLHQGFDILANNTLATLQYIPYRPFQYDKSSVRFSE